MTFVCSENQCGYLTKLSGLWNRHQYQRYCSLPVRNCLGGQTNQKKNKKNKKKAPPLCPNTLTILHTHTQHTHTHTQTHTHTYTFVTEQSDCILPHRRKWLPCRQSWVPFPFNHGWDCTGHTHTHTHTLTRTHTSMRVHAYSCTPIYKHAHIQTMHP